ncbi:PTS sugar transporter subunit IIA [Erysipelothrix aquatica]|uniref:PTS sugar transporter subunit IIA n=1 Tax=Erysipelothrix aquatica TaxID=2683714 RepID=UPI0013596EE2|nr:PTS glucose transporter subunit IIA [Erysipelothrix aquatica]
MHEIIYSPLQGTAVVLEEVNDPMFSQKMLGDGMAIIPSDKKLVAPINGKVVMIFETRHAIGIQSESGFEILIHMGIDTVMLKGKPFEILTNIGDDVKVGDHIANVDFETIKDSGYETVTPVISTNRDVRWKKDEGAIAFGEALFEVSE